MTFIGATKVANELSAQGWRVRIDPSPITEGDFVVTVIGREFIVGVK